MSTRSRPRPARTPTEATRVRLQLAALVHLLAGIDGDGALARVAATRVRAALPPPDDSQP